MESLPIVDWNDLTRDRPKFLSDLKTALADIGFLVLTNHPGLEDDFQKRCFKEAHSFFDSPTEVKAEAGLDKTPFFRGWAAPTRGDTGFGQVIEAYSYAFENEPVAAHDDESVPIHQRCFRGPNTWPDQQKLPGFRPAIEEITQVYHRLTLELGHLTCECLGEDPAEFDRMVDRDYPDLAASLNHNWSLEGISPELREGVKELYAKEGLESFARTGAHVDGPPFFSLLVNDKPGLQVIAGKGRWINAPVTCRVAPGDYPVPVMPGAVIVNVGASMMHMTKGRAVATLHRLNTCLVPYGETRISIPFFLLPKLEGDLVPFGGVLDEDKTGFNQGRDRGTNAAVNRMFTMPACTKVWWKKEFKALREQQGQETGAETLAAFKLSLERANRNSVSAKL